MSRPGAVILLVSRDAALRERVLRACPATASIEFREDAGSLPAQVADLWVDLDARGTEDCLADCRAARRVYFYSTLPDDHAKLPVGLFLKKPCPNPALTLLFSTPAPAPARPMARSRRALPNSLPGWVLEYQELGLRRLCVRLATQLPERLGYRYGALYLHNKRQRVLTLAQCNAPIAVDLGVSLDSQADHPFARVLKREAPLVVDDLAAWCRATGLRPPAGIDRNCETPALLAALGCGSAPAGLLMLSGVGEVRPGETVDVAGVMRFLSRALDHAQRFKRASLQARVDRLTGLFNYRWMVEAVTREIRRAQRYNTALAVIVLDLDGLKRVNDQFGHVAGNALLRHVAGKISAQLRRVDAAARIGGDEFVVMLPATDAAGAEQVAERILVSIRDDAAFVDETPLRATASLGVAEWRADSTARELLEMADQAMYCAKKNGANGVACAGGPATALRGETRSESLAKLERD